MKTKGQASVIGAILFFTIAILLIGFMYEVYSIQAAMSKFDTDRAQERLEISDALFGDLKTYSNPTATNITGLGDPFFMNSTFPLTINSTLTSGNTFPVPNMNYTTSADYWSFTRSYYGTGLGSTGASGAGGVYADFRYTPPLGRYAGAYMNWTTRFYIDLTELGSLTSAKLSWGRRVTLFDAVTGPLLGGRCPMRIYLTGPDNVERKIDEVAISEVDASWVQRSNIAVSTSFFPASGWYKIVIVTQVELGWSVFGSRFQVYLDDIGLILYANIHAVNWYGSFTMAEAPTLVEQIDVSYTGRFNVSRSQNLYIMDASNNRWVLLGTSAVSTSSRTFKYTFTGADVQKYISKTGEIKVRVYAVGVETFMCIADSMSVKDYFTGTTGKITLTFKNTGGVNVQLVSLWIIDSQGHHRFNLDINLSPGQTMQQTIVHSWSYGEYTFKAVTDKGTIAIYSTST